MKHLKAAFSRYCWSALFIPDHEYQSIEDFRPGSRQYTKVVDAEAEAKSPAMQIGQVKISTHSDKEILDACISLIDGVLNGEHGIYQQLADDDFDFDAFEERFDCKIGFSYSYFEIIQRLFLWGTNHSGGTSAHAKCRELGVDAGAVVDFSRRLENEEE